MITVSTIVLAVKVLVKFIKLGIIGIKIGTNPFFGSVLEDLYNQYMESTTEEETTTEAVTE